MPLGSPGLNDMIWRRGAIFTADEILGAMRGETPASPGVPGDPVFQIQWRMNEGSGTSVASIPAGQTGTLSAAVWSTATRAPA